MFRVCGEPEYVSTELDTSFCISRFYLVLSCVICSTIVVPCLPAAKKLSAKLSLVDALQSWHVDLVA